MVKQIYDGEPVASVVNRGEGYFHWLQGRSGISGPLFSKLIDKDFKRLDSDEVLKKKAKEEIRSLYAAETGDGDPGLEEHLVRSIRGDCSLIEVMLCLAISVTEMYDMPDVMDEFTGAQKIMAMMMANAHLDSFDEEDYDAHPDFVGKYWDSTIDGVLLEGENKVCLFSSSELKRETQQSLWQQMNDWTEEHTNEDGDWVD